MHIKSRGFRRERIISATILCFPVIGKFDHGCHTNVGTEWLSTKPCFGIHAAFHRALFQEQPVRLLLFLLLTGRRVQSYIKICSSRSCRQLFRSSRGGPFLHLPSLYRQALKFILECVSNTAFGVSTSVTGISAKRGISQLVWDVCKSLVPIQSFRFLDLWEAWLAAWHLRAWKAGRELLWKSGLESANMQFRNHPGKEQPVWSQAWAKFITASWKNNRFWGFCHAQQSTVLQKEDFVVSFLHNNLLFYSYLTLIQVFFSVRCHILWCYQAVWYALHFNMSCCFHWNHLLFLQNTLQPQQPCIRHYFFVTKLHKYSCICVLPGFNIFC